MSDTKQTLAQSLYDALNFETRGNGERYMRLNDDSPEWMRQAVRAAHGDMIPDDTKYSMIAECASMLRKYDSDDWEDNISEMADYLVDICNLDRVKWLASHLDRAGYCDDAQDEGLATQDTGMFDRIGMGQYKEYEEILYSLVKSITDEAEKDE